MIRNLFTTTVYVKVYKNKFSVKDVIKNNEVTLSAVDPFTTSRLLVGEFVHAENVLKAALKKVTGGKWLTSTPIIVIQPMAMFEGGLSSVEERVLKELAFGAGGRKVVVWIGKELSNEEVIEQAKNT